MIQWFKKLLFVPLFLLAGININYGQNCTVNAGIPETICNNQNLQLSGNSNGLFNVTASWLQIGGPSVNITDPADLNSIVTGYLAGETYTFRISATCQDGVRVIDDVTITINPITQAKAGSEQESCPGTLFLDANSPVTDETGQWSILSNGGGVFVNIVSSPSSSVTLPTTSGGISTLRWTITHANGCSSFDDVSITNYGGVSPVSTGSDQNLSNCYTATQTTTLTGSFGGNGNGGQSGRWTMVSGPNYATISNPNSNSTSVSDLIEGVYIFRWEVSGPCVNGSDEVTITVPQATQDVSIASASDLRFCYGATTAVLEGSVPQYANEEGFWTQVAGPAATITSPSSATTSVTGLDGSSDYQFNYTIRNNQTNCFNEDNDVYIRFTSAPTIDAGANQVLACGNNSATISTVSSGGTNSRYKIISGPGTTNWIGFTGSNVTINNLNNTGVYSVLFERYSVGSGCTSAFDQVNITTSESPTPSNAGNDQNLACNVIETDLAGNAPVSGNGIWSQVEGPNTANINDVYDKSSHIDGLIEGAYTFRWVISGGNNCPIEEDEVTIVVSTSNPSVAAGTSKSVCHSSEVVLEGNAPEGNASGSWTVSPGTGIIFSDSNDPHASVFGMQANTAYTFTWTISNQCQIESDDVILTTGSVAGPSYADAGPNQCEITGTITLNMDGNDPAVGTGLWTIIDGPNSPTITNETLFNTTINGMIDGHYEIEWSINVPGCTSTKDTLFASIVTDVTISEAGTDKSVCGNSVLMTANSPTTNETGHWEQVSGNSGYTISNTSAHDATFSNLLPGRYEFAWIIEKGICPSSSDALVITVSDPPDIAITISDFAICSGTTATLSANNPNIGTGVWSINGPAPNNPTITSINSPTTTVTSLTTGEYQFQWTITSGPDCSPEINDLIIQVSAPATAEPDRQLCSATETFLEGTEGTNGTWTRLSGVPIPTISNTNVHTAIVSNMGLDVIYTFQYEVPAIYGCLSTTDNLTISTSPYGTDPNAGPDQEICTSNGTSITMAANEPGTGTGGWAWVSGPSTPTIASNTYNTQVTNLNTEGVYIFEWNVDYGYCGNYKDVIRVSVHEPPTTANAGTDQTNACQLDAQLQGNLPLFGIGNWTLISAPTAHATSTIVINNTNIPTSNISNISDPGTYTFRWTITNGSVCTTSTDDVDIVFTADPPSSPDAGADQDICDANSITMAGNDPTIGVGTWSQISGPGGATIQNPNNFDTDVTGMVSGTYEYQWEIISGGCTLSDNIVVVNSATPPLADASGTDPDICQFESPILIGNNANPGTGTWITVSGPTSPVITNPDNTTTNVTGTIPGTYRFRWIITNGACLVTNDEIDVTIVNNPITNLMVSGNEICEGSDGLVTINNTENGITYEAFISANSVGAVIGNGSNQNITANASDLSLNANYIDIKAANSTGCTVNLDNQTRITVNQNPDAANAGNDQEVCMTGSSLNGNNPAVGDGVWSTNGGANFVNASIYNTDVSNLDIGINTFTWKIVNTVFCPESTDNMTITNYQNPTVSDAGLPQDICNNSTTLAGNDPAIGTGNWSTTGSGIFSNSTACNSDVSNLDYADNNLIWTISNGVCSPSASQVIVTAKQEPDKTLNTNGNTICENNNGIITIELSETNVVYEIFSGVNSLGTISGTGANINFSVLAANLNLGTNNFDIVATHSITSCVVPMDNKPIVTVNENPDNSLNVSGNIVCDEIDGSLTILSSGNNINYEAFIGITSVGSGIGNGNNIDIIIDAVDLDIGNNTVYVIATNPATCVDTLANQANIIVNANPISDLSITGSEICNGDSAIVGILASENNIQYEFLIDQASITSALGSGNDIEIAIPYGSYSIGNNIIDIKANNLTTSCSIDMENQAVVLVNQCEIIVYDGFSPNGDGINETFIIEGLINHPNHKVTIFNRWGNKVYEASPYLNDWDGTNTFGVTVGGNKLPVGTYFYIIDPGGGSKVLKGYIYLNK